MKVNECLGIDRERLCQICDRKAKQVKPSDAFMIPPISIETGQCVKFSGEDHKNYLLKDEKDGF